MTGDGWGYPAHYADMARRAAASPLPRAGEGQGAKQGEGAGADTPARVPPAIALGHARNLRAACAEGSLGRLVADILAERCHAEITAAERRRRRTR
jgi:hypothetical protein